MGGALAVLAAVYVGETDAVVCWHGVPPEEAADTRKIRVPLQGHFALEDDSFPPQHVDAVEERLKEGNFDYEFYRYRTGHAFGNENNEDHDPEATRLAWRRMLGFMAGHIG